MSPAAKNSGTLAHSRSVTSISSSSVVEPTKIQLLESLSPPAIMSTCPREPPPRVVSP